MHIHIKKHPLAKINFKAGLVEALTIVFAVFTALAVDNWWQGREERRMAAEARERIFEEMAFNYSLLRTNQTRGRIIAGFMESKQGEMGKCQNFYEYALRFGGYAGITYKDGAWKQALNDRIAARMDPKLIEKAYNVYITAENAHQLTMKSLDIVFSESFYHKEKMATVLSISRAYYREFARISRELRELYEEFFIDFFPQQAPQIIRKGDEEARQLETKLTERERAQVRERA